jgi:hypothetical protein
MLVLVLVLMLMRMRMPRCSACAALLLFGLPSQCCRQRQRLHLHLHLHLHLRLRLHETQKRIPTSAQPEPKIRSTHRELLPLYPCLHCLQVVSLRLPLLLLSAASHLRPPPRLLLRGMRSARTVSQP